MEQKQVLEDAGYKDVDGDGYVEDPDGDPLSLPLYTMTAVQSLAYTHRQHRQAFKEIGINIKLDCVSYETLLDRRDSSQYDLLIWNVLVANTGDRKTTFVRTGTAHLQTTLQDIQMQM